MRKFLAGMIGLACAAGVVTIAAQDPKLVEQGKQLYEKAKCADCHVIANRGGRLTKQYPLDSADAKKVPEAEIRHWISAPAEAEAKAKPSKLKMSSRKYAFKDPEIAALTAYMLSVKK